VESNHTGMPGRPKDTFGFPQVTAIASDDEGDHLTAFRFEWIWPIRPMVEFRHECQFRPEMFVG
jgi:hypothetical protein